MSATQELQAAQATVASAEKAALTASKAALDTCVAAVQAQIDTLPTGPGPQSPGLQWLSNRLGGLLQSMQSEYQAVADQYANVT